MSDDYKEAIKQRAKLKEELSQMEPVEKIEARKESQKETSEKSPEPQNSVKTKHQELKEQIAQAIKDNQQVEQNRQLKEDA